MSKSTKEMVVKRPSAKKTGTAKKKANRRSTEEVNARIMNAALSLFSSKGFDGTTIQEVAEKAEVHEPMVYRRFQTKKELFDAAVIDPFEKELTDFRANQVYWSDAFDEELEIRAYVEPLYTLLVEHREYWIAIMSIPDDLDYSTGWDRPLEGIGLCWLTDRLFIAGEDSHGPMASPRSVVSLSLLMGVAMLEPYIMAFYTNPPISRKDLIDEMVYALMPNKRVQSDLSEETSPDGQIEVTSAVTDNLLQRIIEAERRAIRAEIELEYMKKAD